MKSWNSTLKSRTCTPHRERTSPRFLNLIKHVIQSPLAGRAESHWKNNRFSRTPSIALVHVSETGGIAYWFMICCVSKVDGLSRNTDHFGTKGNSSPVRFYLQYLKWNATTVSGRRGRYSHNLPDHFMSFSATGGAEKFKPQSVS